MRVAVNTERLRRTTVKEIAVTFSTLLSTYSAGHVPKKEKPSTMPSTSFMKELTATIHVFAVSVGYHSQ